MKNEAQNLYAQLTGILKDSVTVTFSGVELTFFRDDAAYDQMINDIDSKNKITPIKDYLLAIVNREQREELLNIINIPGLALKLATVVNAEFVPEIEITLKN